MLKIVKATDPMPVEEIIITIFGQPGVGKSSVSFSSEKPLMLDFDGGAYRAFNRGDAVRIERWAEVANLQADDLAPYDTIIVDTVGRALDALTVHIIADNPKMANSSGALTLQGYGALKSQFTDWIKRLRQQHKNVILLAHDSEDKRGDDTVVRPDVQGGSSKEIVKVSDAIGYMYKRGKDTVLDFNPSDTWIGKNCAGLSPIIVPHLSSEPRFMADVLDTTKNVLNEMTEEQKATAALLAEWQTSINEAGDAKTVNELVKASGQADESVRANVRRMIAKRAKSLKLIADTEAKEYKDPEPSAAALYSGSAGNEESAEPEKAPAKAKAKPKAKPKTTESA